jgi:AraC-like DNA-binding protein
MTDFFEKITDSIDKGIKTISSKSKEFIEIARLERELKDMETTLQIKFNAVGKKVFQMMNHGRLDEENLKAEYTDISVCYKKITEIEENIRKAGDDAFKAQYGTDAIMCHACRGINKTADKFCNICGSSLSEIKINKRRCPTCNAQVSSEARFCASCGKAMPKEADIPGT